MKLSFSAKTMLKVSKIMRLTAAVFLMIGGVGLLTSAYPIIRSELGFEIQQRIDAYQDPSVIVDKSDDQGSFGSILVIPPALNVEPVNTTNSIIIEKINVNTPIVWDVDVANKTAYNNALSSGVAHAAGTKHPSEEEGNTYLFAHSTLNPLEIERYAAVFTLLHRLETGDRITVFSENVRYDYAVESVEVVNSFNVEPLTRQPDYPMLTLQTCDPPGIPLNRLIVTAKLIQSYDN